MGARSYIVFAVILTVTVTLGLIFTLLLLISTRKKPKSLAATKKMVKQTKVSTDDQRGTLILRAGQHRHHLKESNRDSSSRC